MNFGIGDTIVPIQAQTNTFAVVVDIDNTGETQQIKTSFFPDVWVSSDKYRLHLNPPRNSVKEITNEAPTNFWDLIKWLLVTVFWVGGLAVAKGFWMTLACIIPPVAWVVFADYLITKVG